MSARQHIWGVALAFWLGGVPPGSRASDFDTFVRPLVRARCVKCHGQKEVNGNLDLEALATAEQLRGQPALLKEMIEVIDAGDMPPEGEPELDEESRSRLLATLKAMLREATSDEAVRRIPLRRLNRFQYNNAVKDLFQLKLDVFELPEKLMTRYDDYLHAGSMPDRVHAASHALKPVAGLRGVKAFPRDLRASHGFDNQANQLTLSPLLVDAFLRLSVSILESPDFSAKNVGVWAEFFQEPPPDSDVATEVKRRLNGFLTLAFRRPVDAETLDRYSAYAMAKMERGLSFTESMNKVAAAALCSPMFLYQTGTTDGDAQFELASKLSFFLWGSGPDRELLRLAESGELSRPENLDQTIQRMFADPKIERFLDSFPSQWMQLDNLFAAAPDPRKNRFFSLDKDHPAGLQMVLEPLLLFDAVFIENRPLVELISPQFSYRSEFLQSWYANDLEPPAIDAGKIAEENRLHELTRKELNAKIDATQAEIDALVRPVRASLLDARRLRQPNEALVELRPYAAWEFDGDLKDSVHSLDLTPHGEIRFEDGMVVLDGAYLLSKTLPVDLRAKSLEVWFKLHDLDQSGGGVMGIQGPGDFFDTIVLGERQARHWISGSNGFSRTEDFEGSAPEEAIHQILHLVMVYREDGTTTLFRNGAPYGKPYQKGAATFPKNESSVIFGLRHLPAAGGKYLTVSVDKARLYDRALTADDVTSLTRGQAVYITDQELLQALNSEQRARKATLDEALLQSKLLLEQAPPPRDPRKLQQDAERTFEEQIRRQMRTQAFDRVAAADPRYGGVITNAAMLSMTSSPTRTLPIARGAWIIEVIFNDPPPPPPNDVPPLNEEDDTSQNLTIREKFAQHRQNPACAACHSRLDPLGFALENFDITGRWRDRYENGRDVDPSGTLLRKLEFDDIVRFKKLLVEQDRRFAKAFTGHLLRFALSRELAPADSLAIDAIVDKTEEQGFTLKSLIKEVVRSESFLPAH